MGTVEYDELMYNSHIREEQIERAWEEFGGEHQFMLDKAEREPESAAAAIQLRGDPCAALTQLFVFLNRADDIGPFPGDMHDKYRRELVQDMRRYYEDLLEQAATCMESM